MHEATSLFGKDTSNSFPDVGIALRYPAMAIREYIDLSSMASS